jgi:hypothetical protein
MSILLIHPNYLIRQSLRLALRASDCALAMDRRGWNPKSVKETSSLHQVEFPNDYSIILSHLTKASPDSAEIARIRDLRMKGLCAPFIGFAFSDRQAHRVFRDKAHYLIVYPFLISSLCKVLEQIKPLQPLETKGFVRRVFCDDIFLTTSLNIVKHEIQKLDSGTKNPSWEMLRKCIHDLAQCLGTEPLKDLSDLCKRCEASFERWTCALHTIEEVVRHDIHNTGCG